MKKSSISKIFYLQLKDNILFVMLQENTNTLRLTRTLGIQLKYIVMLDENGFNRQ